MRSAATVLCAVLITFGLALAQTPQPKPLSPFEQDLVNNENKFMQAFADKNVAYVNQSVAEDFKGIATNGDFYDRDELIGMAHEGPPKDVRALRRRGGAPGRRLRRRHLQPDRSRRPSALHAT